MKLAIVDLDGTLYNTNDVNYWAYKEALKLYDVDIDYDYYCKECNGRHYTVFVPQLVGDDLKKIEDVHYRKKQNYSKFLDKVKVNEFLFDMISKIKNQYKLALVTTASKENTYEILKYTGKYELFDLIITSSDVKEPKPSPEGYNLAISKFNLKPEECVIFEDSDVGIEAALASGASVYKVEKF